MAVVQRQYPRYPQRPAAPNGPAVRLPVNHRRYRTYTRASERAIRISLAVFGATASLLVLYIAGHARMTAVNYQRVQILNQSKDLRNQNRCLRTEILTHTDESAVDAWAYAHGMVLDARSAVVLHR